MSDKQEERTRPNRLMEKRQKRMDEENHINGILSGQWEGDCFFVREDEGKGKGVYAKERLPVGKFVLAYTGNLVASGSRQMHCQHRDQQCYIFEFNYRTAEALH